MTSRRLVKYTPQVNNQTGGGPSAGGQYNRYNNFTIDGANQNDAFGLAASGGVPGGATNAHVISMDAVKEFQVLMAPADVRQGNFTGMAVNMVTKNGTNTWTGGASYSYRNPDFAANQAFIKTGDLARRAVRVLRRRPDHQGQAARSSSRRNSRRRRTRPAAPTSALRSPIRA